MMINDKFKIIGIKAKGANLPLSFNIAPKRDTIEIIGKNKIVNLDNVMIWFKRSWFDWNPGAINKINSIYSKLLESEIMKNPNQYFWFHRIFNKKIYKNDL